MIEQLIRYVTFWVRYNRVMKWKRTCNSKSKARAEISWSISNRSTRWGRSLIKMYWIFRTAFCETQSTQKNRYWTLMHTFEASLLACRNCAKLRGLDKSKIQLGTGNQSRRNWLMQRDRTRSHGWLKKPPLKHNLNRGMCVYRTRFCRKRPFCQLTDWRWAKKTN